jgi:hypothetical protein
VAGIIDLTDQLHSESDFYDKIKTEGFVGDSSFNQMNNSRRVRDSSFNKDPSFGQVYGATLRQGSAIGALGYKAADAIDGTTKAEQQVRDNQDEETLRKASMLQHMGAGILTPEMAGAAVATLASGGLAAPTLAGVAARTAMFAGVEAANQAGLYGLGKDITLESAGERVAYSLIGGAALEGAGMALAKGFGKSASKYVYDGVSAKSHEAKSNPVLQAAVESDDATSAVYNMAMAAQDSAHATQAIKPAGPTLADRTASLEAAMARRGIQVGESAHTSVGAAAVDESKIVGSPIDTSYNTTGLVDKVSTGISSGFRWLGMRGITSTQNLLDTNMFTSVRSVGAKLIGNNQTTNRVREGIGNEVDLFSVRRGVQSELDHSLHSFDYKSSATGFVDELKKADPEKLAVEFARVGYSREAALTLANDLQHADLKVVIDTMSHLDTLYRNRRIDSGFSSVQGFIKHMDNHSQFAARDLHSTGYLPDEALADKMYRPRVADKDFIARELNKPTSDLVSIAQRDLGMSEKVARKWLGEFTNGERNVLTLRTRGGYNPFKARTLDNVSPELLDKMFKTGSYDLFSGYNRKIMNRIAYGKAFNVKEINAAASKDLDALETQFYKDRDAIHSKYELGDPALDTEIEHLMDTFARNREALKSPVSDVQQMIKPYFAAIDEERNALMQEAQATLKGRDLEVRLATIERDYKEGVNELIPQMLATATGELKGEAVGRAMRALASAQMLVNVPFTMLSDAANLALTKGGGPTKLFGAVKTSIKDMGNLNEFKSAINALPEDARLDLAHQMGVYQEGINSRIVVDSLIDTAMHLDADAPLWQKYPELMSKGVWYTSGARSIDRGFKRVHMEDFLYMVDDVAKSKGLSEAEFHDLGRVGFGVKDESTVRMLDQYRQFATKGDDGLINPNLDKWDPVERTRFSSVVARYTDLRTTTPRIDALPLKAMSTEIGRTYAQFMSWNMTFVNNQIRTRFSSNASSAAAFYAKFAMLSYAQNYLRASFFLKEGEQIDEDFLQTKTLRDIAPMMTAEIAMLSKVGYGVYDQVAAGSWSEAQYARKRAGIPSVAAYDQVLSSMASATKLGGYAFGMEQDIDPSKEIGNLVKGTAPVLNHWAVSKMLDEWDHETSDMSESN